MGEKNGIIGLRTFLVTAQAMFLIPARTEKEAEVAVVRAINVGLGMAPQMVGMGVIAKAATKQLLEERGLAAKPDLTI